jgi:DNA-binding CsgD family transcriptional regulator
MKLTQRQSEVLKEICKGKSNKEIARTLGIEEQTVKQHVTSIFLAKGVRNRSEVILQSKEKVERVPLTRLDILEEFVEVSMTSTQDSWANRVVKFGMAVERRSKNN